jgi:Poly (ADP-ribose) glycohydrolase (PARG)
MVSPELIAGMLFMPSMEKNEAIEIIGSERFSHHKGLVPYVHTYIFFSITLS